MNQTGKIVILIVLIIAIVFAVYVLLVGFPGGGRTAQQGAQNGQGGPGSSINGGTPVSPETIEDLWYYNKANASRYEKYAGLMQGLPMEDVIWMVEVDLDIPPYEDALEVPDPDDLLLLVNKHFLLRESFTPDDLMSVNSTLMREEAAIAMNEMINAAAAEGHQLWAQSGFRSYGVQASLYEQYANREGVEAADTYSARPGHSEHQSGLTADLNTITDAFGETPEGIWASENCWKFGFIERYTVLNANITLYRPEPWHMRYIGKDAAAEMHELGFLSYEEYWVKYVKNTPPG